MNKPPLPQMKPGAPEEGSTPKNQGGKDLEK